VVYQIFPERFANGDPSNDPAGVADWNTDLPTRENFFGGDLAGIRDHVGYLRDLGIDVIYTTPIFEAQTNHRYDASDYLKVDPVLGTLETFRELVATLKASGIRLVLDAVFNHCGDGFWAFRDVIANGAQSPYADWFTVDSYPITFDPPSFQTCGGAPFLPKLNVENPEVRAYLLGVTEYWLKEGIDGWRLDVPWKVTSDFWPQFRERVLATNPDAYTVAETWRGTSEWLQGDRVNGVMNYRLRQYILDYAAFDHMDAEDFDYELRQLREEHGESAAYHLTLLGSHDTARIRTMCKGDVGRLKIAITIQMTYLGVPMVYYGDEIGMEGDNDPDCRRPMIWDESRWDRDIYDLTCRLIALRHAHPALRTGAFHTLRCFNGAYAYGRSLGDDRAVVVLNPRQQLPRFNVPLGPLARTQRWVDTASGREYTAVDGQLVFEPLPAKSAFVLIPAEG
jgi:glycosidase